ncbi:DUF3140 domain-containing protein [Pseudokineococcus marinus]|uniref:DUF3140 domain-containing protein n=1 Tax=Pseudokineococcus marinus TaxID=351215 RepID=A0A849BPK8_9ACTN|nr:DUF3140 domain-containing protein [Pseudokineococcus marinus]NNH22494.1 DUF3140 domain-containing protein [Pseudokineococcus marinus]
MAKQRAEGLDDVWDDWQDAVNMTPKQLEEWLETDESKSVGDTGGDGESTGHQSGRRIVEIQRTKKDDLTEDDVAHMKKVVGYVHRHRAQKPKDDVEHSRWRYSLMNWGNDPLA